MFIIYIVLHETSSCEWEILGLYFVWQNVGKSKLYTGLHKVNYLLTLCLFKVGRLLCNSLYQNILVSSLFSPVKRRNILCSGEHGKKNIKWIVLYMYECLCEILHLRSTVGCSMSTLFCGKEEGSRNSSCMPRCRFNVLNVHLQ